MTIAGCRSDPPCGWEIDVEAAKVDSREAVHMQRIHPEAPPSTDELCDRMVADHASEVDVIVAAIELDARMHNGEVDPNRVRGLIPPGVTPQLVGATYRVMRRQGRLTPIEQTVSTDTHGRNVGKPATVYRLREQVSAP